MTIGTRLGHALAVATGAVTLAACGATTAAPVRTSAIRALQREMRPIGRGPRFQSRPHGPILGACDSRLGARTATHVEVFAENRVVLLPAGIGVEPPMHRSAGRITAARCGGEVVTLDPTGVALVRGGSRVTLADLFRSWGVPLTRTRLAGFRAPAGTRVRTFVDGRPHPGPAGRIPLTPHAEIVLEVGPYVPPHRSYAFPPSG